MRGSNIGRKLGHRLSLAICAAALAGVAGCSLPEVLPLAGNTTPGPSPYGPWYEQHWATNSVLLAAADQPEGDSQHLSEDVEAFQEETTFEETLGAVPDEDAPAPIEASARTGEQASDFDNSTPYQFPASQFAPQPARPAEAPAHAQPSAETIYQVPAPVDGPIRY